MQLLITNLHYRVFYFSSAFMKARQGVLFWIRAKTEVKVGGDDSFDIIFISESFKLSTVKPQLTGTPQD